MGKKVCEDWGSLIDIPLIRIENDEQVDKYIDTVLKNNNFNFSFNQFLEKYFALGGGCLITTHKIIDNKLHIGIDFVDIDRIMPLDWSNDVVNKIAMITTIASDDKFYHKVHIFEFEKVVTNYIENKTEDITNCSVLLYVSDSLQTLGQYAGCYDERGNLYESDGTIYTFKVNYKVFHIFRPNIANNFFEDIEPMGISLLANSKDTIKAIDITYHSYVKEVELGKKRIMIPQSAISKKIIHTSVNGIEKEHFIKTYSNDEVYVAIDVGNMPININNEGMTMSQAIKEIDFNLRIDELQKAMDGQLGLLAEKVGLGIKFYEFSKGTPSRTATEVISEKSTTYKNMKKHQELIAYQLTNMTKSIIKIGVLNNLISDGDYDIKIKFDDSVIVDDNTKRTEDRLDVIQGNLTRKEYLLRNFGYSDNEAEQMITNILEEQKQFKDLDIKNFVSQVQ